MQPACVGADRLRTPLERRLQRSREDRRVPPLLSPTQSPVRSAKKCSTKFIQAASWLSFRNLSISKISTAILSLLFLWGSYSPVQVSAGIKRSGSVREQTVPGTTLAHFGKVDEGVYKGSRPRTDADYQLLQSRHVKYILDLQLLPSLLPLEQERARRHGMEVIHARINASPVPPSEEHIASIMAILRDKRYRPIYFHCALGRDRTALVAALYKMYFMGMSQRDAWRYMVEAGFKESWLRDGLKKYLFSHPAAPKR
jgi:rhodanese-related sulfurtransferase